MRTDPMATDNAPTTFWTNARRWLGERAPSLALSRALSNNDQRFLEKWAQGLKYNHDHQGGWSHRYDVEGFTPVQNVVRFGRADLVPFVLYKGGSGQLLQKTRDGQRLLDLAPDDAVRDAVLEALDQGLRQAKKDHYVVYLVDRWEHPEKVAQRMLDMRAWLEAGADPDRQTADGFTGKMSSRLIDGFVSNDMIEATGLFLSFGADPHRPDRNPSPLWKDDSPYNRLQERIRSIERNGEVASPSQQAIFEMFDRGEALMLRKTAEDVQAVSDPPPVPSAPRRRL